VLVGHHEPHGAQIQLTDPADYLLRGRLLLLTVQPVPGDEPWLADSGAARAGLRG
jgi:hypothetical protein